MSRLKVLSIFGTRPEAIKMAPLLKLMQEDPSFEAYICVTAQHREMLDQVLHLFRLKPHYDLDIMAPRQTLFQITCRALQGLEEVIDHCRPDLLLVHGDTTTTFAGALAAFYQGVPCGHVEAGLRTGNPRLPFPEEMNRRLTGSLSTLHFAPTARAKQNLLSEGTPAQNIFVTGNTVIDALQTTVRPDFSFEDNPRLARLLPELAADPGAKLLLVEAHRRENWGEPLASICRALLQLLQAYPRLQLVFPVHKNPVVRETAQKYLGSHPRAHLLEPLDTASFHNLMARAHLILTDSGGIQEEAPSLGKPVLVLRRLTERPEAVQAGTVKLVGTAQEDIFSATARLLDDPAAYRAMARAVNPYGDGRASQRILQAIRHHFGQAPRPKDFNPSRRP
ncbi:MAG: UDP-N-acetylglucosamine 2-epimerase (non-hydrolyzing) [Firmicutes bacterium]|nr:UDP-N-acetylglucosamine 2-epimerase (non-hydrolyzing) [Bacillota bacterium]